MKVLLINTFESRGGAAVACRRLANALNKQGIEVNMLVMKKTSNDKMVTGVVEGKYKELLSKMTFLLERVQIYLINRFSKKNLFAVSTASIGIGIHNHELVKQADIIHFHWINQGFLSLGEIGKITTLGKPVFWTMHDMWPVTGICHHSRECDNYMRNCGSCMFLQKPGLNDISKKTFDRKKSIISGKNINFVACSNWLKERAKISAVNKGNLFNNIPNPIDTEVFCPGDIIEARKALNLPLNKRLLLFGALIASDKRKGIDYLVEATKLLADLKDDVELVFCGEVKEEFSSGFGLKSHALGYVSDPKLIVKMYQACDCFVIPSLEENLPNMIMESMSCGKPCVAFRTGGIPEMIKHCETGYIAKYKSAEDLSKGIRFALDIAGKQETIDANRNFILENYSEKAVAEKYITLYNKALHKS